MARAFRRLMAPERGKHSGHVRECSGKRASVGDDGPTPISWAGRVSGTRTTGTDAGAASRLCLLSKKVGRPGGRAVRWGSAAVSGVSVQDVEPGGAAKRRRRPPAGGRALDVLSKLRVLDAGRQLGGPRQKTPTRRPGGYNWRGEPGGGARSRASSTQGGDTGLNTRRPDLVSIGPEPTRLGGLTLRKHGPTPGPIGAPPLRLVARAGSGASAPARAGRALLGDAGIRGPGPFGGQTG